MNASTDPLIERFLELCSAYPRLRRSIATCKVEAEADGMIALLQITPQQSVVFWHFMPFVAHLLPRLAHFKALTVWFDGHSLEFKLDDLMAVFPDGDCEPLPADLDIEDDRTLAALLPYLTERSHVFTISLDGIYQNVCLRQASPATIAPAAMIGKPLAPFIGEAAAAYLITALRHAYAQGKPQALDYAVLHPNGEPRLYSGTILPIAGAQACYLLSNRVTSGVLRHSLAVPG